MGTDAELQSAPNGWLILATFPAPPFDRGLPSTCNARLGSHSLVYNPSSAPHCSQVKLQDAPQVPYPVLSPLTATSVVSPSASLLGVL